MRRDSSRAAAGSAAQGAPGRSAGRAPRGLSIAFIGGRGVVGKYSGIETYYEHVGRELAARGHEIVLYCRTYFTPEAEHFEAMRLVRLPTIRTKHLETFVHSLLSTLHAAFTRYDVVHFHALGSVPFIAIARLCGLTTVASVQGLDWKRDKWGPGARFFLRACEWLVARMAHETIVVSKTLQRHFVQRVQRPVHYIPNGVEIPTADVPPDEILKLGLAPGAYVLYLGRLSPEKQCHLLAEAFSRLDVEMKLVIAGGSSYTDDYIRLLRGYETDRIRLVGYVTGRRLQELLSHAALFVLPSRVEGLSLALLEAMSYGRCVLVSDIPENREIVENVGYTFRVGDGADLTRVMSELLTDEEKRKEAGVRARRLVERKYGWAAISQETERVYRRAISRRSSELHDRGEDPEACVPSPT